MFITSGAIISQGRYCINFEKETGIKLFTTCSIRVLEAKLLAGNTGFDIVVPSSDFLARQIKPVVFSRSWINPKL